MAPFIFSFYHFVNLETFMEKTKSETLVENKMVVLLPITINKLLEFEEDSAKNFKVVGELNMVE